MAFDFTGKKFLVTGVGRGIGRTLTKTLIKSGATVYGLTRTKKQMYTLIAECPKIIPITVDLADWDATRKEAEKLPALDGLVNNAAICFFENSLETPKDHVEEIMSVNVLGALNLIQIVAKRMIDAGKGGSIVNVSCASGISPFPNLLAYNMSKGALDTMTRQFALELGPHQIRVNSVNPTTVGTDMSKALLDDPLMKGQLRRLTPLGREPEIHEVVGPILYLLSDVSSMVTGTIQPVEGGLTSCTSL